MITERIQLLSVTDPLTHLWNRRKLVDDLEKALHAGPAEPHVLALYDLNGFKRFNDLFGHPAGDALLERLAAKLVEAVGSTGTCYRLGGDEFCVLARVVGRARRLPRRDQCRSQRGRGRIRRDHLVRLRVPPGGGDRPERAMQIADQRLYARKHHTLIERGQPHGVLLQALYEREPDLRHHVGRVAALSLELGRRLELDDDALRELELAAQLHDIGKLAIPDSILDKQEPLSQQELEFVRRHTIIGERILSAAPALSSIGVIVRANARGVRRQRLSGRARRHRDPARGTDHRRLRHLLRDHVGPPVPGAADQRRGAGRVARGRRHPTRSRARRALLRDDPIAPRETEAASLPATAPRRALEGLRFDEVSLDVGADGLGDLHERPGCR